MNKLISYTVGLLILFLSGCASTPDNYWAGPKSEPLNNYRWDVESPKLVYDSCRFKFYHYGMACVFRLRNQGDSYCLIQSNVTEEVAKQLHDSRREFSLWYHERIKHCLEGLNHGNN